MNTGIIKQAFQNIKLIKKNIENKPWGIPKFFPWHFIILIFLSLVVVALSLIFERNYLFSCSFSEANFKPHHNTAEFPYFVGQLSEANDKILILRLHREHFSWGSHSCTYSNPYSQANGDSNENISPQRKREIKWRQPRRHHGFSFPRNRRGLGTKL